MTAMIRIATCLVCCAVLGAVAGTGTSAPPAAAAPAVIAPASSPVYSGPALSLGVDFPMIPGEKPVTTASTGPAACYAALTGRSYASGYQLRYCGSIDGSGCLHYSCDTCSNGQWVGHRNYC